MIITSTVFLYKISVETGQFEITRRSIFSGTEDQHLQLLLVGFAFGAFLEGAAGFGAPMATTAHRIGGSDALLVAVNTTGGVTGKMISPQSVAIAIACVAAGLIGREIDEERARRERADSLRRTLRI